MRHSRQSIKLNRYVWWYPILFFFIAWISFKDSGGTDFDRQVFMLQDYEKEDLLYMVAYLLWGNDEKILYHIIYYILNDLLHVSPRFYIALITLTYYCLIALIIKKFSFCDKLGKPNAVNVSNICLVAMLSLCPMFFTTTRNFCAVTFLYLSFFLFLKKKYIIALILVVLAYFVHEGILIMYSILVIGLGLYYFWLRKSKNYLRRNVIITTACVFLLVMGGTFFSSVTKLFFENGMLSEHYMESYGEAKAGDGVYKLVLVLSMLGPLIVLFVNCILDKRNNLIYGITVAGLFSVCFLYNQKIFLVQRIMIFMPLFIGLTSYQICMDYKRREGRISQLYLLSIWLLPFNVLFQFVIQFNMYFGNLF